VFEPPTPLPSASRTRRRSRQSLTPHKADPIEFKTPARSAKWEEEVSLGSIEIGAELEEVVEVDEGDGDDEVEYMPPPMPGTRTSSTARIAILTCRTPARTSF
jgi:hypothetical protein